MYFLLDGTSCTVTLCIKRVTSLPSSTAGAHPSVPGTVDNCSVNSVVSLILFYGRKIMQTSSQYFEYFIHSVDGNGHAANPPSSHASPATAQSEMSVVGRALKTQQKMWTKTKSRCTATKSDIEWPAQGGKRSDGTPQCEKAKQHSMIEDQNQFPSFPVRIIVVCLQLLCRTPTLLHGTLHFQYSCHEPPARQAGPCQSSLFPSLGDTLDPI